MILKEDEKQALLEALQMMGDIYWGPEPQKCKRMFQRSSWLPFERLIPWLDPPSAEVFKEIKILLDTFSEADTLYNNLEEDYVRLFISDSKGIRTPLHASCYIGEETDEITPLMGKPALDMRERFKSKGLSIAADVAEPPDHLAIELEYLYFLLERGWAEKDNSLLEEAFSFSSEVMLPWVMKLQKRLDVIETENHFYPFISTLLCSILKLVGCLNKTP